MINEASITTATPALGSIKMAQADGEIPLNAQLSTLNSQPSTLRIALLTGGGDKPYALGMAAALTSVGIRVDFIGSDDLNVPEVVGNPRVNFLNLRGDQRSEASAIAKMRRVLRYYLRLIGYAATHQWDETRTYLGLSYSRRQGERYSIWD